jgi:hypothetical protein
VTPVSSSRATAAERPSFVDPQARNLPRSPSTSSARRRLDAGGVDLLDVRQPDERASGHAGNEVLTGGELTSRIDNVPERGRPVVVALGSGYRLLASACLCLFIATAPFEGMPLGSVGTLSSATPGPTQI